MLAAALEPEVDAYLAELAHERDQRGRRLVVRNGHAAPRVNDKRVDSEAGQRQAVPVGDPAALCRKSPKIADVLPLLYLHDLSTGTSCPR